MKKKIVIAPDSFKGTLSAVQVADIIAKAALDVSDNFDPVKIPIADGGEGTIDAFGALKKECTVQGPNGKECSSYFGVFGNKAIIEMACAAGLPMADPLDATQTTTYGVGQLIMNALDMGFRDFVIGLGGSATNDCGCGMACACGVKFYNSNGKEFVPVGGTLIDIASIDLSQRDKRLDECNIVAMCDIENPLYGEKGAAFVFAPQKGANETQVKQLDIGLIHISEIIKKDLGKDVSQVPGAGAAGGCGAGVIAFLGGKLQKGIDVVLDASDFDSHLGDASYVFTGEGKFDSQTAGGKAISGIAKRTQKYNVPLIVFCGAAEEDASAYDMGVTSVFSIQRKALPFEEAKLLNADYLYKTAYNVFKLIK